jgi:hypothetical protein
MVVTLCAQMPVQAVARHLGIGDDALWRVLYACPGRDQHTVAHFAEDSTLRRGYFIRHVGEADNGTLGSR